MGSRNPSRVMRLRELSQHLPGFVRVGRCGGCGYISGLPIASMIAKEGPDAAVEFSAMKLRCSKCNTSGKVEVTLLRLCDPGCGKQRG